MQEIEFESLEEKDQVLHWESFVAFYYFLHIFVCFIVTTNATSLFTRKRPPNPRDIANEIGEP